MVKCSPGVRTDRVDQNGAGTLFASWFLASALACVRSLYNSSLTGLAVCNATSIDIKSCNRFRLLFALLKSTFLSTLRILRASRKRYCHFYFAPELLSISTLSGDRSYVPNHAEINFTSRYRQRRQIRRITSHVRTCPEHLTQFYRITFRNSNIAY